MTEWCIDNRHGLPCPFPCVQCGEDCDPDARATGADVFAAMRAAGWANDRIAKSGFLMEYDPEETGSCDTCGNGYPLASRDGRCGDCADCGDCCTHLSTVTVTLSLTYNTTLTRGPHKWDWYSLLDLQPGESVALVEVK